MRPSPTLAAVHEAGHAVAAILTRSGIEYATVTGGRPHVRELRAHGRDRDAAVVAMAGSAAEFIVFGREHAPFRRDGNLDWHDVRALLAPYPAEVRGRLYRSWRARAIRLIAKERDAVLRVARALDRRGTLNGATAPRFAPQ